MTTRAVGHYAFWLLHKLRVSLCHPRATGDFVTSGKKTQRSETCQAVERVRWLCVFFPIRGTPRGGERGVWNGRQGRRSPCLPPWCASDLLHGKHADGPTDHGEKCSALQTAFTGTGREKPRSYLWWCWLDPMHPHNCEVQLCQPGAFHLCSTEILFAAGGVHVSESVCTCTCVHVPWI